MDWLARTAFGFVEHGRRRRLRWCGVSTYIRWNREAFERPGRGTTEVPMSLLTTSIESTRQIRWNFGLVALTLLGVFAIALALMLPNSITP
jgi:hypothetical protein